MLLRLSYLQRMACDVCCACSFNNAEMMFVRFYGYVRFVNRVALHNRKATAWPLPQSTLVGFMVVNSTLGYTLWKGKLVLCCLQLLLLYELFAGWNSSELSDCTWNT